MIDANVAYEPIDSEIFTAVSDDSPSLASRTTASITRPEKPRQPFDAVVGQATAVELLRLIATGITFGGEADPILLQGPSGRGKTLLASQFATALSLPMVVITCGREVSPSAFIEKIVAQATPAVVFLDEVHSLPKRTMELLFGAIDDARLPAFRNGSIDRTSPPAAISRHVWVAATNMPGGLLRALRSRLVTLSLADYSQEELERIALLKAESLDLVLAPDALTFVARACGGSPRVLGHLLKTIAVTTIDWRYARDYENADATLGLGMVEEVVGLMGLDRHGLDATSRAILAAISSQPSGSTSAESLSVHTGLDLPFVRERLAELRGRGLVTASPGRGWTVASRELCPAVQESSSIATQGAHS